MSPLLPNATGLVLAKSEGRAASSDSSIREQLIAALTNALTTLRTADVTCAIIALDLDQVLGDLTDVDIAVFHGFDRIDRVLASNGWMRIVNVTDARSRRFYQKVFAGRRLKLDLSDGLLLYQGNRAYRYRKAISPGCDRTGLCFVDPVVYLHYCARKYGFADRLEPSQIAKLSRVLRATQRVASNGPLAHHQVHALLRQLARATELDFEFDHTRRKSTPARVRALFQRTSQRRKAIRIAFVGLDGAGKGTYIARLRTALEQRNNAVGLMYLGHGQYRSAVVRWLEQRKSQCRRKFTRRILRAAYMAALPYEYARRRFATSGDVVIMDRHPSFEPMVALDSPWRILDLLCQLACPTPQTVFFLTGNTETIHRRKQEFDLAIYEKRAVVLEQCCRHVERHNNIVRVDVCRPEETVWQEILDHYDRLHAT